MYEDAYSVLVFVGGGGAQLGSQDLVPFANAASEKDKIPVNIKSVDKAFSFIIPPDC